MSPCAFVLALGFALATPRADVAGVPNFAQVSPVLYRGAQPTADGFRALAAMGIHTIVDLRRFHGDRELLAGTGLRYVEIPCSAWHPESEDVLAFLKVVLDPANQPVFVHCQQGADRTGYMVAVYRILEQGVSLEDALLEMEGFGFHAALLPDVRFYLEELDPAALARSLATAAEPAASVVE